MSTGQIFFAVGIAGMIASAVAGIIAARALSRQEKKAERTDLERISMNNTKGYGKCFRKSEKQFWSWQLL